MDINRAFELILIAERAAARMGMRENDPPYLMLHQTSEVTEFHAAIAAGEYRQLRWWLKSNGEISTMKAKDFDRIKFLTETWPDALESGEFKQGRGELYSGPKNMSGAYCCLGVACELLSRMRLLPRREWITDTRLPEKACTLLGINDLGHHRRTILVGGKRVSDETSLANINDSGVPFKQIAALIRRIAKSKRSRFVWR